MLGVLIITVFAIALRLAILVATVALIVWVVKKVWYKNDEQKYSHKSSNSYKYRKSDQTNTFKGPKKYPSGWTFNEETQIWDPPEHLQKKSEPTKIIELTVYEKQLADKIRIDRKGPTFEEWKLEQQRKNVESETNNRVTEDGTYRFSSINTTDEVIPEEPIYEKAKNSYKDAYEARPILSYNESRNYKTLKEAADRKGYTVQIKMRLADIVKPRTGEYYEKYYEANFRRISQYHVDFTILNDRMKVVAIVELDDNSHDRPDRKERDEKVDSILTANNIKIIHTRHITSDILDDL